MIIEIKGVQFVNKGAELMLVAVLQQIRQLYPEADIALLPSQNAPYAKRAKLAALQIMPLQFYQVNLNSLVRLVPKVLRRKLKNWFGIIFQEDVDLVLDASGFAYGDRWGRFGVKFLAANAKLIQSRGGRYILLPQAFGPFSLTVDRKRMAIALSYCTLAYARDADSLAYLHACAAGNTAVRLGHDFTNLVSPPADFLPDVASPYALLIPNYQMLYGKGVDAATQYQALLLNYVRLCLAQQLHVVVLNHEGSQDAAICRAIKQEFAQDSRVHLREPEDALLVKAWIGHAELVFSSRFHGCVSALSQGIYCIGTAWSHKYHHLFADYQMTDWLVELDVPSAQLESLIKQRLFSTGKALLVHRSEELKQAVRNMWLEIADKTAR